MSRNLTRARLNRCIAGGISALDFVVHDDIWRRSAFRLIGIKTRGPSSDRSPVTARRVHTFEKPNISNSVPCLDVFFALVSPAQPS
jgi:hypothetical protein